MDCSSPGFPELHCLLGVCSNSCPLSQSPGIHEMPSSHLILCAWEALKSDHELGKGVTRNVLGLRPLVAVISVVSTAYCRSSWDCSLGSSVKFGQFCITIAPSPRNAKHNKHTKHLEKSKCKDTCLRLIPKPV